MTLSKLSKVTQQERNWINALCRSDMDLTQPFTASEACEMIRDMPTRVGKRRSIVPNKVKLNYTFRKSHRFECVQKKDDKKPNLWRLIE